MTSENAPVEVFGWSADNHGCEWYRLRTPLTELARRGRTTAFSRYLPRSRPNIIIGQRVSNPGPSRLWQELSASDNRPRMIYELDDDLFHIDPENAKAYAFFSKPEIQANIRANIAAADAVVVSTEPLAAVVREYHDTVHVVPNYLPEVLPAGWLGGPARHTTPTVVGWAGSGTHGRDFAEAGPELARFLRRTAGVRMHMIGAVFPSMLRVTDLDYTSWLNGMPEYYATLARSFDIGVAPLAPTVFNRSKSPIKAMEYAAFGIPTVASNVGPYADYIEHGVTGLLVTRPHEWSTYLRDLVHDQDLRANLAAAAHKKVAGLTIGQHVEEWERVIDGE